LSCHSFQVMSHPISELLDETVGGLIDKELEWRELGTFRVFAEDTEPQRVDWKILITLPRICRAFLNDVTLPVPGSYRH